MKRVWDHDIFAERSWDLHEDFEENMRWKKREHDIYMKRA